MTIRPFRDQDRGQVLALLGDARAIDTPDNRLHVDEEGQAVSLWVKPGGGFPFIGSIRTSRPGQFQAVYRLARAACQDAIEQGFERGYFKVLNRTFLEVLQRAFDIDPQPSGWEPNTGKPIRWKVEVDLRDALAQLDRILALPPEGLARATERLP